MRWSRAKAIDLGLAAAATVWLVLALTYWRPVSAWWLAFYVAFAVAMWAALWVKSPRGRWRYTLLVGSAVLVWLTAGFLREGRQGVPWAMGYGFLLLIVLQDTVREFRGSRRPPGV